MPTDVQMKVLSPKKLTEKVNSLVDSQEGIDKVLCTNTIYLKISFALIRK